MIELGKCGKADGLKYWFECSGKPKSRGETVNDCGEVFICDEYETSWHGGRCYYYCPACGSSVMGREIVKCGVVSND